MNKADLVDKIAGACEISKAQATTAIDTAVESITGALRKGDRVALIGFGTFSVSQRKARNGRNPQTGATIKIAARKVAKFSPGAELKKAVNKKWSQGKIAETAGGRPCRFLLPAAFVWGIDRSHAHGSFYSRKNNDAACAADRSGGAGNPASAIRRVDTRVGGSCGCSARQ